MGDIIGFVKDAAGAVGNTGSLIYGIIAVVLLYVFKKIPNDRIYMFVASFANNLGTVVTLGLTKWKFSAPLWNAYIEPWIIDFIDNTVGAFVRGFIAGLRSDNVEAKDG